MIHITNGDTAASGIRAAGVPGEVFAWRDVLHDGPVPGDISFNQLRAVRARFISDSGWGSFEETLREFIERDKALERSLRHEEVVLWFEHDLYDQLQLLQLLDWFATCELGATKLSMICNAEYLGPLSPTELAARFPSRTAVSPAQLALGLSAWAAFRSPSPVALEDFLSTDTSALPFLKPALTRFLEQYPSTVNGLSRTQSQALRAIADGATTLSAAFVEGSQKVEEPIFLGDSSFANYISGLSVGREPLVVMTTGARVTAPVPREQWNNEITLTDAGRAVMRGDADYIALNGVDKWLGGVHLEGDRAEWRWDPGLRAIKHFA